VAGVSVTARRVRVVPAPGALPGDETRDLDLAEPGDVRVERVGLGRLAVHGADGVVRSAWVGEASRSPTGTTRVEVVVDGWRFELDLEDAERAELRRRATRGGDADVASIPAEIRAIIPGRIAAVRVTAGDAVEAGQTLLVVEAMKMQNELRATRAGIVESVGVGEGDTIDTGDVLVVVR
jgi:acetyl/propionyl-CoA carboxylase alpha subunit